MRKHNIGIKVWGVSFEEKIPIIKSEYLTFDVCESDIKSEYVHISLKMKGNSPEECELHIQFEPDFYFVFIEKNDDGTVSELDYYDDLCDK